MSTLADELHQHQARRYSQNGEDGVLQRLLEIVGVTNRFYVEFGAGSGAECNTRLLRETGWSGLMMDCACEDLTLPLYREFITAENINDLLVKYRVPESFDVLSTDIDGNDYWVWKAISPCYQPRVVIMEYNRAIPITIAATMPYEASYRWVGQPNTGQSLLALNKLAAAKGYVIVYAEPPNAFLVLKSILPPQYRKMSLRKVSRTTWREHRERRKDWKTRLKHLPWVYV